MSTFQIVLTGIFASFIIIGLVTFGLYSNKDKSALSAITIWGTVPEAIFTNTLNDYNNSVLQEEKVKVTYTEFKSGDFDKQLIEALASGIGPDAIILSQDLIAHYHDKIFVIPYSSYPLRNFKDNYIDQSGMYVYSDGILALPISIDPMVMYWNRELYSSAAIAKPPQTWTEVKGLVKKLSKKDKAGNITQSAFSLGEYKNINNAKAILSSVFLQAGTGITKYNSSGLLVSDFSSGGSDSGGGVGSGAEQALSFYTSFANPVDQSYTWNRSLQKDIDLFISGDLATYFGYASEIDSISDRNPNLDFDVALIPQIEGSKVKKTFGRIYGLAVLRASRNPVNTYLVLSKLSGKTFSSLWAQNMNVVPAMRSLLVDTPDDPNRSIFYTSAFMSRGWIDPDINSTNQIFKQMIEDVTSGFSDARGALSTASRSLDFVSR